uniref:CSON005445 protein n=1 Tax=Culicoides sonorensis TaxID=179676 RepID=A0A336MX27_CULSO
MSKTVQLTDGSCRICLEDEKRTISFKDTVPSLKQISYTELFQDISGITLLESGPQRLCKECGIHLVEAYELKQKIKESENLLLNLIEQLIVINPTVEKESNDNSQDIKKENTEDFDGNSQDFVFGGVIEADVEAVVKIDPEEVKSEDSLGDYTEDEKEKKKPSSKSVKKQKQSKRTHKKESQSLSLRCSICLEVFTKKYDFRNHYRVMHVGQEIQCPNCPKKFNNADEFDKHIRHGHKKRNREKTLCPHCAKVMLNTSIQEHIKSIHEEHHREYICDLCGVRAKSKDILTGHMKFKHQNLTYNCRYCPEIFKNKGTRRTHEIRFHTFDYKHVCNICEKKFMTNAQLKKHRVIHTGEKPHACEICGQRFSFRAGLKDHQATHAETRDFICDVCSAGFKNNKALRKHHAVHEDRNYECPVCGQKFLENKTLRAHCTHSHPDYQLPPPGTVMNKKALARVGKILEKYHVHAHHSSVPRKLNLPTGPSLN